MWREGEGKRGCGRAGQFLGHANCAGTQKTAKSSKKRQCFSAPEKGEQPESMVKEFRIGPQRSWSVVAFTIMTAAGFQSVGDR
jgi:hypothetical protein